MEGEDDGFALWLPQPFDDIFDPEASPPISPRVQPPNIPRFTPPHIVASHNKTQSKDAKALSIADISHKLISMENYDIGGTYSDSEADLWFYFLASISPGYNHLMNLFVCSRKKTSFSIGVSKFNEIAELKNKKDVTVGMCSLSTALSWQTYRAMQEDECFYIKTFCFSQDQLKMLQDKTLLIPIRIDLNSRHIMDSEMVTRIKVDHEFGALLAKQEKTDLILESASRKTFPVHKVILAAHSPVLRELIKDDNTTTVFLDISDEDMELILQFVYTGTIKDFMKQDCVKLFQLADKFQLKNLLLLTQYVVSDQIQADNAVEIAIISEKYKLELLQTQVFSFIKNNPEVLSTDGWKNLNDVNLTKKLFQFMQTRVIRMYSFS